MTPGPVSPHLAQLPAWVSGTAVERGPGVWALAAHVKDLEEAPGSLLRLGAVLAVGDRNSRWKISLPLSLSLSLSCSILPSLPPSLAVALTFK